MDYHKLRVSFLCTYNGAAYLRVRLESAVPRRRLPDELARRIHRVVADPALLRNAGER